MKSVDKDINLVGENVDTYSENSLLSIFKYCQSKVSSNKSSNNHILNERIYINHIKKKEWKKEH